MPRHIVGSMTANLDTRLASYSSPVLSIFRIVFGLFTRIAAFIASGEMAFAYFYQHWPALKGGGSASFWPFDARQLGGNGGELAIMFCFAFLLIATTGAGSISADARRRPRAAGAPAGRLRRLR